MTKSFLFIRKHNKFSYRYIKILESIRKNVKINSLFFCKKPGTMSDRKLLGNLYENRLAIVPINGYESLPSCVADPGSGASFDPWNRDPG